MIYNRPDLSIIVPAFNIENYISDCLTSVLKIKLIEIELIVINDGSNDDTLNRIKQFSQDKRLILIDQNNQGLGAARNNGLLKANGDYVTFLDGDDTLDPDNLVDLFKFTKNTQSDIVFGRPVWLLENDIRPVQYLEKWFNYENTQINQRKNEDFAIGCPIATSKVFKKSLIDDVYFPINQTGEDVLFSLVTWEKSKIIRVFNKNIYYRTLRNSEDDRSITQTFSLKILEDRQKVINECVEFCENKNLQIAKKHVIYSTINYIESRLHKINRDDIKTAKKKLNKLKKKHYSFLSRVKLILLRYIPFKSAIFKIIRKYNNFKNFIINNYF